MKEYAAAIRAEEIVDEVRAAMLPQRTDKFATFPKPRGDVNVPFFACSTNVPALIDVCEQTIGDQNGKYDFVRIETSRRVGTLYQITFVGCVF